MAKSASDRVQSFGELLQSLTSGAGQKSPWEATTDDRLATYLEKYRARCEVYLETNEPLTVEDTYLFSEERTLQIMRGDLVAQEVDALVGSDDLQLTMGENTRSGVSSSILLAGGRTIYDEAQRYIPVRPGRVVITSAGSLKARFVFHAVTLGAGHQLSRDLIAELLRCCLYHAETLTLHSIALPLLGTGNGGLSRSVCLETMFRVLTRAMLYSPTPLRDVRIVLHSPNSK